MISLIGEIVRPGNIFKYSILKNPKIFFGYLIFILQVTNIENEIRFIYGGIVKHTKIFVTETSYQ